MTKQNPRGKKKQKLEEEAQRRLFSHWLAMGENDRAELIIRWATSGEIDTFPECYVVCVVLDCFWLFLVLFCWFSLVFFGVLMFFRSCSEEYSVLARVLGNVSRMQGFLIVFSGLEGSGFLPCWVEGFSCFCLQWFVEGCSILHPYINDEFVLGGFFYDLIRLFFWG